VTTPPVTITAIAEMNEANNALDLVLPR